MITCKKYQPSNHQARIQCQKRDSATFYSLLLPLEEENKQPTIEKDKKRKKVVIHLLSCSHHATTIAIGRSGVRNIYLPTNTLYDLGVQSYKYMYVDKYEQNRCAPRLKGDDNALAIIYSANHPFEKKVIKRVLKNP